MKVIDLIKRYYPESVLLDVHANNNHGFITMKNGILVLVIQDDIRPVSHYKINDLLLAEVDKMNFSEKYITDTIMGSCYVEDE